MTKLIAFVLFAPLFLLYKVRILPFMSISCLLAMMPGECAVLARQLWYKKTLRKCGDNLRVQWMAVFIKPDIIIGNNVYVGPFCWIASVCIGHDVILAAHVRILSGKHQHSFDRMDIPIRKQKGKYSMISIGNDVWVGDGCVIMEDIASGTVVGAGSVVTKKYSEKNIIASVPAKVLRKRG